MKVISWVFENLIVYFSKNSTFVASVCAGIDPYVRKHVSVSTHSCSLRECGMSFGTVVHANRTYDHGRKNSEREKLKRVRGPEVLLSRPTRARVSPPQHLPTRLYSGTTPAYLLLATFTRILSWATTIAIMSHVHEWCTALTATSTCVKIVADVTNSTRSTRHLSGSWDILNLIKK